MTAIHETAYPRSKPHFTHKELKELFWPAEDEMILLNQSTKKTLDTTRLGFMILLKCYQYLGRSINLKKVDDIIKKTIAEKLSIKDNVDFDGYDQSTRKRHIKIIRKFLNLNANKKERRSIIKKAALEAATTKENLADIINVMLDELIKSRFELPAFRNLLRLARAARTVVNNGNYQRIVNGLSDEQKKLIDSICGITLESENSENNENQPDQLSWAMLKLEPKKPTWQNIKDFVLYVNRLLELRQTMNVSLDFMTPARLEHLRDEAMIADMNDMQEMRPMKRYALAVIFISIKAGMAVDDLIQIFILLC